MNTTKTFDDLFAGISTTETSIRYTVKAGAEWSDVNAWLEGEYPEEHWGWRKFEDVVVVFKTQCVCDECLEDSEDEEEDDE